MEGGTLHQIRNLINRRNVSPSTVIRNKSNEIDDFLVLVVNSYLMGVAMHNFGMTSMDASPSSNCFPSNTHLLTISERKLLFLNRLHKIIDKYVTPSHLSPSRLRVIQPDTNPHDRQVASEHCYTSNLPDTRQLPLSVRQMSDCTFVPQGATVAVDGVLNYSSACIIE